jgi:major membrane immunogen (membrane-anchored lipoprotein)
MNYRYRIVVAVITLTLLAGCGSSTVMQSVSTGPFTIQMADSYHVISTAQGADATYQAGSGDQQSVIQFAQSRVDSGVTVDQMASLNLQKLELSLP